MNRMIVLATAILLVPAFAAATPPTPLDDARKHVEELTPDPTRPFGPGASLRILTPLDGAEVGGRLLVEGIATPARGYDVRYVGIYVDGIYMGQAQGKDNWSFLLDTRGLIDGRHTFSAYAFAALKAAPFILPVGYGQSVAFRTLNHQTGVVLFQGEYDVAGAAADAQVVDIKEDYTGLRVTIEGKSGAILPQLGPRAQVVLAYKEAGNDDRAIGKTWLVTYGMLQGGAFISRPPHGVLEAPGVLTVTGVFAGEGHLSLKVEAVKLASIG